MFTQNYNPFNNVFLSTLAAAIPIVVLLYFIALHPHRDARGQRHFGISAPWAAFAGVVAAFAISTLVFRMPLPSALSAFSFGALSGTLGIIWVIVSAMFLYTMTVITGRFEIVKESIIHVSFDRRLQVLLIAFSFGAILEGTSGFGTPVAIAGAIMVGLGFPPMQAAVLNLLANTAPVAFGAIGTPILTLGAVTGLDAHVLSQMAGRQLLFISLLIPFWLVVTFVKIEGGSWKEALEVWPATLVAGASFAVAQFLASQSQQFYLVTNVVAGVFSVVVLALFLRIWHPKSRFLLRSERERLTPRANGPGAMAAHAEWSYQYTLAETIHAWVPWVILIACVGLWGAPEFKVLLNNSLALIKIDATLLGSHLGGVLSLPQWDMPALHNLVQRMPPVVPVDASPETAQWKINWLSSAGTGVLIAAILSGLYLRMDGRQWRESVVRTAQRMKTPIIVIVQVLGLGFLTRYSGTDAVLGLAFTGAGLLYPFFAAFLGWLGVFLTGSDTASNALFGSLQKITAGQLGLSPVLIATANSTGGVMGKMIDAQSIMVASAACYDDPYERSHSLGPIFRTVFWHSLALTSVVGVIVLLQAYVFPWMIPEVP